MAYQKYYPDGWKNSSAGGTPIVADALNHMEEGIATTDAHVENIVTGSVKVGHATLTDSAAKATTADSAGYATSAGNAGQLGGRDASLYIRLVSYDAATKHLVIAWG